MKKELFFLPLVFLLLCLFSCEPSDKLKEANEKIAELEGNLEILEEDKSLIKAEYNEVIDVINEIDESLMEIDAREKQMENLIGDLTGSELQRELIMGRIKVLKEQNVETQGKANSLQAKLNKLNSDNASLNKIIKQYETKLKEKDAEIAAYEVKLNQIEGQLKYTKDELAAQYGIIAMQKDSLARKAAELENSLRILQEKDEFIAECTKAWYVAGSKKTLRQAGILKKGGINLKDDYVVHFNRDFPFNMFRKTEIEVDSPIQAILPLRPEETYEIQGNTLFIKDVEAFWQTREVVIVLN